MRTIIAALSLFVAYTCTVFFPFDWNTPPYGINPIRIDPDGGLASSGIGVARTRSAPEWLSEVVASGSLTIRLRVSTADPDQFGPARIMTISQSHSLRNFTIAQDGRDLIVLLRTTETNRNGEPGMRVEGVFGGPGPIDIELAVANAHFSASVNGRSRLQIELPKTPFRNWSKNYRLALANEFDPQREVLINGCRRLAFRCPSILEKMVASDDGAWRGRIFQAEIETDTVVIDYAKAGRLTLPNSVIQLPRDPELIPFFRHDIPDTISNLLGFVPFGFFVGSIGLRRRLSSPLIFVGCVTFASSLGIESMQFFLPTRSPSITDVLMNILGGVLGFYLAQIYDHHLGRRNNQPSTMD